MDTSFEELAARLEARLEDNQAQIAHLLRERGQDRRRARLSGGLALAALVGMGLAVARPAALAQSPGTTLASLVARISALEQKTAPITTMAITTTDNQGNTHGGYLVTFTGANVQVVNGMGNTETQNGLGNLIVGYNEKDPQFTQARTGSHNLVVGHGHNYLSYGGIVAGLNSLISAPYASVTGGYGNVASGNQSSVSGGAENTASGAYASVSGGQSNKAAGYGASVTGGQSNSAYGSGSTITGGQFNVVGDSSNPGTPANPNVSGVLCAISGGQSNAATGSYTAVSGGQSNTATGNYTTVSGGANRYQSHDDGWTGGHYATDGP